MAARTAILTMAVFVMSFTFHVGNASDPAPLQDFCVGVNEPNSKVSVNGMFCKNSKTVETNDFIHSAFKTPVSTNNTLGLNVTMVDSTLFPALNTLGVSIGRVELGINGLNPLHLHPRASEATTVLEGTVYAGFITSDNKLVDANLRKGDIMVFPQGLIHFQFNIGRTRAVLMPTFSSQHAGRVDVANAVFGSHPPLRDEVLTKGFQVGEDVIQQLQAQFSGNGLCMLDT